MSAHSIRFAGFGFLVMALLGCASTAPTKKQAYAAMPTSKTFEYEFPQVWRAIEAAVSKYKVIDRDPEEVSVLELGKLTERELETDWIYTRSRDKYVEYKVNGLPRRQELQTRVKYEVSAERVMGGVNVRVRVSEELERLNEQGVSQGYSSTESSSALGHELLQKIEQSLLSARPQ